jgi:transcriptional regulator with XRE-family HTH domain
MNGSQLRAARQSLNLTQESLAKILAVDRGTVARWEREERRMPPYLHLVMKGLGAEIPRKSQPKKPKT